MTYSDMATQSQQQAPKCVMTPLAKAGIPGSILTQLPFHAGMGVVARVAIIAKVLCGLLLYLAAAPQLALAQSVDANTFEKLTIYIPGSKGGGFDNTGIAIRNALLAEGLVEKIDIVRSPGAGGLIGLAQFIEAERQNGSAIFVGGRTLLGAASYNHSEISLDDTHPLARLNGAVVVIVVADRSPIISLGDLIETMRRDPELVRWVGGSIGSNDEFLVKRIAGALGVEQDKVEYIAVPGGGEKVAEPVLSNMATAAVSSYEEFAHLIENEQLRIIAVSTEHRVPSIAATTLLEYGIDVSLKDWRGVFAAPGLKAAQKKRLAILFKQLSESTAWAQEIDDHKWQRLYLPSQDFQTFLNSEKDRVQSAADEWSPVPIERMIKIIGRPYRWAIFAALISLLLFTGLAWQRYYDNNRKHELEGTLDAALLENQRIGAELEIAVSGASAHINEEFEKWKLTPAEFEIGWMLLKGLSFREIAGIRAKSERTVRQQARSIYAKSGLGNRSDLAGYFLEDFFLPQS